MRHNDHRHPARPAVARRGLVLPLVLIAMAIAIILGMCFLTSASTATSLSTAADQRLHARMIAESGLSIALGYIESDRDWRTTRSNGVWVTSQAFDGGTFTVSGEDGDRVDAAGAVIGDGDLADDNSDPIVVTSVGVYQGTRHLVRAVRFPPKLPGIAVSQRAEVKRTAQVDGFNPDRGAYAAGIATSSGIAQSNGVLRGPYVRLYNRSRVNGNVYYGVSGAPASAVAKDATAIVTGLIGPLPAAIPTPDIAEPNWPNAIGVDRSYSSGVTLLTTDTWYKNFELKGNATFRAVGNVKMYVNGDMNVTEDAKIEVGNPMAYAAAIKGLINVDSTVPVDSYDSSVGLYGGTNVSSKALLATNSVLASAVTVKSAIKGDVYSGVGSVPTVSIVVLGGSVSGTRGALTTAIAIPAPPPMPTDVPASVGSYSLTSTLNLNANMQTGDFLISGGGLLRASGDRKLRVNGDFTLDGGGLIDVPAGATLSIYVAGQIKIAGNGTAANNVSKQPSRLIFYGLGSGYTHVLSGNAQVYAIIDAPNSTIAMDGNAQLFGAVMASSLSITNNAELHNDRNPAVVDANPRLAASYTTGSSLAIYTNNRLRIQQRARVNTTTVNPLLVTFYHLGAAPMDVGDTAAVYGEVNAPESKLNILGNSRWTGRIEARDLAVGGTAVVTADASGGTARPGVLVEETVEMTDDAILNGTGGTAVLGSRGYTDSTIRVVDTSVFKGDGYTAVGGTPGTEIRVAATATFTGTKNPLRYPLIIAALTAPPVTSPVTNTILTTGTTTLSGDVSCANFEVSGDAIVDVIQDCTLVLTGTFRLVDNAQLILRPGVRMTVHCPGSVEIWENARVNVGGNPRRLTLSCPATPRIELRDAAGLSATVLAPLAELKLNHTAQFYGSFAGRRVKVDRSAKFHCAHPLPGPVTWIEQQ
jgi:hypothetical protein